MKVGEIWTLRQHHVNALVRYAKIVKSKTLLFVTVEIISVEKDFVGFLDLEHNGQDKCKRRDFVSTYQKIYGDL